MPLTELPFEMVDQILSYDGLLTQNDLVRIALMSKKYHWVVLRVLYRYIHLRLAMLLRRFCCTVYESPEVATVTKSIYLDDLAVSEEDNLPINQMLVKLGSLQALNINQKSQHGRIELTCLDETPPARLRTLDICDRHLTCDELARYMCLPNIKNIMALYCIEKDALTVAAPQPVCEHLNFLTTFEIYFSPKLIPDLVSMLSCALALKALTFCICTCGVDKYREYIIRPSMICEALNHSQQ